MNLKDVFQWVDKVMKSLHSAWAWSLEKGSRVRDRSWNLLLENDEHNFKYTIFIWSIIHTHLRKIEEREREKLRESSITDFPHVSITHLDTTLLLDFSWNKISDNLIEELSFTLLATFLDGVCSNRRTRKKWDVTFSVFPYATIKIITLILLKEPSNVKGLTPLAQATRLEYWETICFQKTSFLINLALLLRQRL